MRVFALTLGLGLASAGASDDPLEFCPVHEDFMDEFINFVKNSVYQPSDDEDMNAKLDVFAQQTILKIRSTQIAPCDDIQRFFDSMMSRSGGLNCQNDDCRVAMDLRGIWGYGCWCNFGGHLMNGRGKPQSPHDAACKNMQLCLRCAQMDGKDNGYHCDPRTTSYNASFGMNTGSQSIDAGCSAQNPGDNCAAHVCTCEINLINEILDLVWSGHRHDPSPRHPTNPFGGSFDAQSECPANPAVTEMQCCGEYPSRVPYNALKMECCEATQTVYNPFMEQC